VIYICSFGRGELWMIIRTVVPSITPATSVAYVSCVRCVHCVCYVLSLHALLYSTGKGQVSWSRVRAGGDLFPVDSTPPDFSVRPDEIFKQVASQTSPLPSWPQSVLIFMKICYSNTFRLVDLSHPSFRHFSAVTCSHDCWALRIVANRSRRLFGWKFLEQRVSFQICVFINVIVKSWQLQPINNQNNRKKHFRL